MLVSRQKIANLTQTIGHRLVVSNGLKVDWHGSWDAELDEALRALPEMEDCPHDLYRLLLNNPGPDPKSIALVREGLEPVAAIGLRQAGFHWVTATQWLLPGAIFPVKSGYMVRSLEALGINLDLAWWRQKTYPPESPAIRQVDKTHTYRMDCSEDPEIYWRRMKHFKSVRISRNRCHDFTFHVNLPGALDWTIKNWFWKWFDASLDSSSEGLDRLAVARYLQDRGLHYTLSLQDHGDLIASATLFVQGNDLVAGVNYRKKEYNWHGVGNRLLDLIFFWAHESGYRIMDIGGGHAYKEHWAPRDGHRWLLKFNPAYLYYPKQFFRGIRSLFHFDSRNENNNYSPIG